MFLNYISVARGAGILIVVLGHVWTLPPSVGRYIHSFHIPFFFVLAGYLYNKEKYQGTSLLDFLRMKFNRLVLPYFTMAFTCYLLFVIENPSHYNITHYAIGIFYSVGSADWMPRCAPLWFLTCLFCVYALYLILEKSISRFLGLGILVCSIFGYVLSLTCETRMLWNVDIAFTGVAFFYIGRLARSKEMIPRFCRTQMGFPVIVAAVLGVYMISAINESVSMAANRYGNYILFYAGALMGSFALLAASYIVCRSALLEYCGDNTLPIMGFNYYVIHMTRNFVQKTGLNHWYFDYLLQVFVLVLIVSVLRYSPQLYWGLSYVDEKNRVNV